MKAAAITMITILYVVAGLFVAAIFIPPVNHPASYLAAALALATAYGATVLLRSLIGVLREDRRNGGEL